MSASRLILTLLLLLPSSAAFACSCSNGTPIQKNDARYADRAVFTAHVVSLMGRVYNWNGKRESSQVLAVVNEHFWGMPWYWPKVVVLDGSYPCDIAMEEGRDYLVSGRRLRYGVLGVSGCSRTQPLDLAQVDLRTLDGSECAGPGGTVIGHVHSLRSSDRVIAIAPFTTMTFRDQDGQPHPVQSDRNGLYELRNLPIGPYTLDSYLGGNLYLAGGGFTVRAGLCGEANVSIREYDMTGQFLAGLGPHVSIKLVAANGADALQRADVQSDGHFYFKDVPDGEYLLAAESVLNGYGNDFYYPGTSDRHKAKVIKIADHQVSGSSELDFDQRRIPYVPIRVVLDIPKEAGFSWRVLLATPNNIVYEERWMPEDKFAILYGLRGQSYTVRLWGDPDYRIKQGNCQADIAHVTASPGLGVLNAVLPAECR